MAAAGVSLEQQAQAIQAKIKTLLNSDLKEICRGEGLQVSGVKNALQNRIIGSTLSFLQAHPRWLLDAQQSHASQARSLSTDQHLQILNSTCGTTTLSE